MNAATPQPKTTTEDLPPEVADYLRRDGRGLKLWHITVVVAPFLLAAIGVYLYVLFGPNPPITYVDPLIADYAVVGPEGIDMAKTILNFSKPDDLTPDNNMAVDFVRAFWPLPELKDDPVRQRKLATLLEIDIPPSTLPPIDLDDLWEARQGRSNPTEEQKFSRDEDDSYASVIYKPWRDADFPQLAKALDERRPQYEQLISAADKNYFWLPSPDLLEPTTHWISFTAPHLSPLRSLAREMLAQSNRLIAEGELIAAWEYQSAMLSLADGFFFSAASFIDVNMFSAIESITYGGLFNLVEKCHDPKLLEMIDSELANRSTAYESLDRLLKLALLEEYGISTYARTLDYDSEEIVMVANGNFPFKQDWNRYFSSRSDSWAQRTAGLNQLGSAMHRRSVDLLTEYAEPKTASYFEILTLKRPAVDRVSLDPSLHNLTGFGLRRIATNRLMRLFVHWRINPSDTALQDLPADIGLDPWTNLPFRSARLSNGNLLVYADGLSETSLAELIGRAEEEEPRVYSSLTAYLIVPPGQ